MLDTTHTLLKGLTLSTTTLITAEDNVNVKSKALLTAFKAEFMLNTDKEHRLAQTHAELQQWITTNVHNKAVLKRLNDTLSTILSYYVSGYEIKVDLIPFTLLNRVLKNTVNISKASVKKLVSITDEDEYTKQLTELCTIAEFKLLSNTVTSMTISDELKQTLAKLTDKERHEVANYLKYVAKKDTSKGA